MTTARTTRTTTNGPQRGGIASRGLTPLLDTLFILLFALLMLSDTRTETRADLVRIQLPKVEPTAAPTASSARRLVIELVADSRLRWQQTGEVLRTRAELDRVLTTALGDSPPQDVAVEIQGDQSAGYGIAVELLQHLRLRGFTSVSVVARGTGGSKDAFGETR